MNQSNPGARHNRSYAPEDLKVFKGPRDEYKPGSYWVVGDDYGYAELLFMRNSDAFHDKTLYIENIVVKEPDRGKGYGRRLYKKIECFADNLGLEYIQIDSELEVVGFWKKLGFQEINKTYYKNKKAMIKEV